MTRPDRPVVIHEPDRTWRLRAACRNHEHRDNWFASPDPQHGPRRTLNDADVAALKVCDTCPVRGSCLDFAMSNNVEYGIYGGKLPEERRALRKRRHIKGAAS